MYKFFVLLIAIYFGGCASPATSPQSLNWTGNEAYFKRDYKEAIKWYTASLENSLKTGDKQYEAISMYGLARANGHLCKLDDAEIWLVKSIKVRKSLPNLESAYLSQNIFELGRLYMAQGKWVKANEQYSLAFPLLEGFDIETKDPLGYANLLEEYQQILEQTGKSELAAMNSSKIEDLRKSNQDNPAQYISDPYPSNCTIKK